jgi:regulatory protein YycI of two-component signal transduction system YycFG
MDWSKAKTILIYIFIGLNIFLIVYMSMYKFDKNVSRETIANTRGILSQRGINLECAIPDYSSDTARLIYENGGLDKAGLVHKLFNSPVESYDNTEKNLEIAEGSKKLIFKDESFFAYTDEKPSVQLDISDKDEIERYLREFLKNLGLHVSNYKVDWFSRNDDGSATFIFTEKYGKYLVFDNCIRAVVAENGITNLECSYSKVKGLSKELTKIMPAYKVLLKNFSTGEDLTIISIDFGFKGYEPEGETLQYSEAPAWRIRLKDGTSRYFKASDGDEIASVKFCNK